MAEVRFRIRLVMGGARFRIVIGYGVMFRVGL